MANSSVRNSMNKLPVIMLQVKLVVSRSNVFIVIYVTGICSYCILLTDSVSLYSRLGKANRHGTVQYQFSAIEYMK